MSSTESGQGVTSLSAGDIPRGAELKTILESYRDLREPIRCGRPECRQKHNNGFVVRFACDGVSGEGVIGKDCGMRFFGREVWNSHYTELRARERLAEVSEEIEYAVAACEALLPHAVVLVTIADEMAAARKFLSSHGNGLASSCDEAGHRHRGVLTGEVWDDKKMEFGKVSIRLPSATFWFRRGLEHRIGRLEADLRLFPGRVRVAKSPKEVRAVLDVLGAPYDRMRELAGFVAADLPALFPDKIKPVWDWYRTVFRVDGMRLVQGTIHVREEIMPWQDGYWTKERAWVPGLDLERFRYLMTLLEPIQAAVTVRRAA